MAALMRMSKLVTSSAFRCSFRTAITRSYTLTTKHTIGVTSRPNSSKIHSLTARYSAVSISENLLQNNAAGEGQIRGQGQMGEGRSRRPDVSLQNRIQNIDMQIRRTGRVDRGQIFNVLNQVKREGSLTEQEALVLIRACGVLVKENPETRQNVLEQTLKRIQPLVENFDISHHNAVLRTRLENHEKIEPAQVLADIEQKYKLFPNRITYQLLISAYCEQGDLEGASKILQHMKSQDIPVNEAVFHALINGNFKQGNPDAAKKILESMKPAGLLPLAESYTTLMNGLAASGDVGGLFQALSEADAEEVSFQSRNLFEVVTTLVENGHSDHLSQLLNEVRERFSHRPPFNHEAMNCAFRLTVLGKDAEALEVLKCIVQVPDVSYKEMLGRQFLEVATSQNRSIEVLSKLMDDLKDMGYLSTSYLENIALWSIRAGNTENAMDAFKMMVNRGEEVRRGAFVPLFRAKQQENDHDGLCRLAAEMKSLLKWDKNVCYNIVLQVVDPLKRAKMSTEDIFSKLVEHGLQESHIKELELLEKVSTGEFSEATSIIKEGYVPGFGMMSGFVSRGYRQSKDLDGVINFLETIKATILSQLYFKQLATSTLSRLISYNSVDAEEAEKITRAFVDKNFLSSKEAEQQDLVNSLREKAINDDSIMEIEESLQNMSSSFSEEKQEPFTDAYLKSLEAQLEKDPDSVPRSIQNKGEILLLQRYCREGDIAKADALKEKLDHRGFRFPGTLLSTMAIYEARFKKNFDIALERKNTLKLQEQRVPSRLHLALAQLYVEQGDIASAIAELNEADTSSSGFRYQLVSECELILNACKEPSDKRDILNTLFDKNFCLDGMMSLITNVMKAYLEKGDPDEIVAVVEDTVKRYNKVAYFRDVLDFLIQREDAERLQKVVDLMSAVYGEMDVLHHLTFSFVECGKIRQAKKILETPGLKAVMPILNKGMERYYMQGQEQYMRQIVDITKDMFGISRDDMLFWLMRLYVRQKEIKKALGVLTNYEEEGTLPRPRTLRYLAKVLQSEGMDVPFTVPSKPEQFERTERTKNDTVNKDSSPTDNAILDHLTAGEVDRALELRNSAAEKGDKVTSNILRTGLLQLHRNRQHEVTKDLLTKLAENGEVDTLLHIRHSLPQNLDYPVHRSLFKAYVHSERAEEFLNFVSGNINMLTKYMDTSNVELLATAKPDLFPKLVSLVMQFQESSERYNLTNILFNYYLLNDQSQEAFSLLEKFPDMKSSMHIKYLTLVASAREKESLFPTLLELAGDTKNFGVYNRWIKLRCRSNDVEGATSLYEKAKSNGMELKDYYTDVLETYQGVLEAAGKPVPWEPESLASLIKEREQRDSERQQRRRGNKSEENDTMDSQ